MVLIYVLNFFTLRVNPCPSYCPKSSVGVCHGSGVCTSKVCYNEVHYNEVLPYFASSFLYRVFILLVIHFIKVIYRV